MGLSTKKSPEATLGFLFAYFSPSTSAGQVERAESVLTQKPTLFSLSQVKA